MRTFNWAEEFKEKSTVEDIPASVRKLERNYWICTTLWAISLFLGTACVFSSLTKLELLGLLLALLSAIGMIGHEIIVKIRLSTYRIIWDSKNRIEMEIRKSEAQDL